MNTAVPSIDARLPVPPVNADTEPFWAGCAQGELRYQQCVRCGSVQFPPRGHCATCQAQAPAWRTSARRGSVHSFTVVHRAPTPAFRSQVPYLIALVDLDEGFRLMVNLRGCAPEAASIGARVRIVFEPRDGMALPQAERLA